MTYTVTSLAPPRIAQRDAMLIFGLGHHYHRSNAGIPSQWDRFVPHLGNITGQVDNIAYGVICNTEENGSIDYICGVEVREFPQNRPNSCTFESAADQCGIRTQ